MPRLLPRSGGRILERAIPGTGARDAMGCYPLFSCQDWGALQADLDQLSDLISLSVVTDPFGAYDRASLERCFPHLVMPFKQHLVADLARSPVATVSKHHRYYARKALEQVVVERHDTPGAWLNDWCALYDRLRARHHLTGIKAFSRGSFALQLTTPGIVMLRAVHAGETVGAHLWYRQGDVVYSHLAASSERGYDLMASYALYWTALEVFADEARWLNLGAGAGVDGEAADGLTQFKRGWATETRTAYFCGRILDPPKYQEIVEARGVPSADYFPAYRQGELG